MSASRGSTLFSFPNPVNEVSARLVAAGVVGMAVTQVLLHPPGLLWVLAYGFWARVLTGPKLSPLGQLVTRVVTPRLRVKPRWVAGPPKRFAQGLGAAFSSAACVLAYGFHQVRAADLVLGMLVTAALLEAGLGFCLGCQIFRLLMRVGIVPASVCMACADFTRAGPLAQNRSPPSSMGGQGSTGSP